jgi:hypothetical protein
LGTLLKQQVPVRTFAEWNEAKPGFMEADLVAPRRSERLKQKPPELLSRQRQSPDLLLM